MDLIIKNDELVVIKPTRYVAGQLSFWGFKEDEVGDFSIQTPDKGIILEKIVNFFESEKLPYSLSPEVENISKEREVSVEEFTKRKCALAEFKENKFDKDKYKIFTDFLSNHIPRELKEHQKKSAFHLYLARNGANFSVPGSGKTTVVLSVYEKLRQEGIVDTLFVIGPPSSFGPWRREFKSTLGRDAKHVVLAGGNREVRSIEYHPDSETKAELYLTTFQTVLRDQDDVIKFLSSMHVKAFVVVDEAHYMKRVNGNWSNAILRLSKFAKVRCILTGTPLPKSYSDVFNLFDFLWPDHKPITENNKSKILVYEKEKEFEKIIPLMEESVNPLFYRVRKKDLGLTKPIFHEPIKIRMNHYESLIYKAIENKIRELTTTDEYNDVELVLSLRRGRLMRLRQAASYTGLLETALENYKEVLYDPASDIGKYIHLYDSYEKPAKLEHLIKLLQELQLEGEKALVWSNFLGTINLIKQACIEIGIRAEVITGATPVEQESVKDAKTREQIRDEFVDLNSGLDVLIANPAACAESISLHTGCHHAIYYDLSYNCAQYLQSLDRIHRVGGSETIFAHYHFLEYEDTIDDDIRNNLNGKAERMYAIVDTDTPVHLADLDEDIDLNAYERVIGK